MLINSAGFSLGTVCCIGLLMGGQAGEAAAAGVPAPLGLRIRAEHGIHSAPISAMMLTQDERRFVTAGADGTVRSWDLREQRLLKTLHLPWTDSAPPAPTAITADAAAELFIVASHAGGSPNGDLLAIERNGGKVLWRAAIRHPVAFLAMKDEGKSFWSLEPEGPRLRAVHDGKQLAQVSDCHDSIAADLSPHRQLAVACGDGTLRLYGTDLTVPIFRLALRAPIHSLRFSPDSRWLAVGFRDAAHIEVIPLGGSPASPPIRPDTAGISGDVRLVAWSRTGDVLLATGSWQEKGQTMLRRWSGHGAGAYADAALPGGQELATQIFPLPLSTPKPAASAKATVFRDFSITSAWLPDSLLVATAEPALWQVPPRGDVRPWPLRHRQRPASTLFVDSSGGWLGLPLADAHELQFSLIGRSLRLLSKGESSQRPASAPPRWAEIDHEREELRISGRKVALGSRPIMQMAGSADGKLLAVATTDQLWFLTPEGVVRRGAALPGRTRALGFSEDGRLLVAALADGTVQWFGVADGKPRLSLTWGRDATEWAAWTPSGYYDSSPHGGELLTALVPKQGSLPLSFRVDQMQQVLNRPDIVARVLFTTDEQQAIEQANAARGTQPPSITDGLPPVLQLISAPDAMDIRETVLPLRVRVSSPSGQPVESLRITVISQNGRSQRVSQPFQVRAPAPGEEHEVSLSVGVFPEDCTLYIKAQAKYADSEPAVLRLRWRGPAVVQAPIKPKLYLLAVGVSRTRNSLYKLGFPAKDALDISETFARQEGKRYRSVIRRTLTDEQASLANIRDGLAWLQKEPDSNDVVVIFMAGHGKSDLQAGSYYFYPHDASDSSPETTRLSSVELRRAVNQIQGSVVLFLDTCQAGGALDRQSGALGADLQRLAAEVATAESSIIVFTASTGAQSASERKVWGNGAFTKAVVEGLRGKADQAGNGLVTVSQLESYVSTRVRELTDDAQFPTTTKPQSTVDFALSAVSKPIYRHWWFWGGVGLVAATAVTGILLATKPWEPKVPEISF